MKSLFLTAFLFLLARLAGSALLGAAPDIAPRPIIEDGVLHCWAPGVIGAERGTLEIDVEFLRVREAMSDNWYFIFRAASNSKGVGNTTFGLVFCPPGDGRDFALVARSDERSSDLVVPAPRYDLRRVQRLAVTWGDGEASVWLDGEHLGTSPFHGQLRTLPETFTVGLPGSFRAHAVRVSSQVRPARQLARATQALADDDHTTLLAIAGSPSASVIRPASAHLFPSRREIAYTTPAGVALTLPLRAVNSSGPSATFRLSAEIRDRAGQPVATLAPLTRAANSRDLYRPDAITLPPIAVPGFYQAELVITPPGSGKPVAHPVGFVVQMPKANERGTLADYLGHHHYLADRPDAYTQLGIRWDRAWQAGRVFLWCEVEPAPGDFQWGSADRQLAAAEAVGVRTLGILGNPPPWASTYSETEFARVSKTRIAPAYSHRPDRYQPRDIDEWKTYVRAVVTRYKGRVSHWEIYNEVDFHPPFVHATFSGTTRDYFDLLAAAHQVIHEVDPSAQVLTSGFNLNPSTDRRMLPDLIEMGAASHFDVIAVHGYAAPEMIQSVVAPALAAKPGTPIWQTERAYMGGARDDYRAIHSAFWCLEKGFSKYYLHGVDLDRHFSHLNPTAYYAITAELARQLTPGEAYEGPVAGLDGTIPSWRIRRVDGKFLHAFSVPEGRVRLAFAEDIPHLEATNLHGELLHSGPLPAGREITIEDIAYFVAPAPLAVAHARAQSQGYLLNPGFEERVGDFVDASGGSAAHWSLQPENTPESAFRYVKGRSDDHAVALDGGHAPDGVRLTQPVKLGPAGNWRLSAWVRVKAGVSAPLRLSLVEEGGPESSGGGRLITGTGDWQRIEVATRVRKAGARGHVHIGLEPGPRASATVEIDDVELAPVTP